MRHRHIRALINGALWDGQQKSIPQIANHIHQVNRWEVNIGILLLVLMDMSQAGDVERIEVRNEGKKELRYRRK